MKKLILSLTFLCAIIFFASNQSYAQTRFGIKAGVSLMTLNSVKAEGVSENYSYRTGFQGGVFVETQLSDVLFFGPQLLYTQKGGNVNLTVSGYNVTGHTTISYLDLPVLIGFKATPKLSFLLGPQVSFLLTQKSASAVEGLGSATSNDKTQTKSTAFGGNAGVAYDITNNIGVNVHYMRDFSNAAKSEYSHGEKNQGFVFSLSYKF